MGPSGVAEVSSSTSLAALRVGSIVGTYNPSGDSMRKDPIPSCVRAATITQSAVWPSSTSGFSPLSTQSAPLRRAGTDAVDRITVAELVQRDRAALRAVGETLEEAVRAQPPCRERRFDRGREVRAGERDAPHLLEHDDRIDETQAEATLLLGDEDAGPAELDDLVPDAGVEAALVVAHRPHVRARRAVGQEGSHRLAQSVLVGGKREIHGSGGYRRNLTRVLASAPVMDFSFTAEDEAFRDELQGWLDVNLTKFLESWDTDDDPGGGQVSGFDRTQEKRKDWQRRLNWAP